MSAENDNLQEAKRRYLEAEEAREEAVAVFNKVIAEWQEAILRYEQAILEAGMSEGTEDAGDPSEPWRHDTRY